MKTNLGITILMEADFAPDFNASNLASHLLSHFFEVLMASTKRAERSCILIKKEFLNMTDQVSETKLENGFFSVKIEIIFPRALLLSTQNKIKKY